jgi:hypothetical protein
MTAWSRERGRRRFAMDGPPQKYKASELRPYIIAQPDTISEENFKKLPNFQDFSRSTTAEIEKCVQNRKKITKKL